MEKFNIEELLTKCAAFLNDPTDQVAEKSLEDFKRNMVIRSYIPIDKKTILVDKCLMDIRVYDNQPSLMQMTVEIACLFDLLLPYIANLDIKIEDVWKDSGNYDLLYEAGIPQYILKYCKDDYERLEKLLDRTISWDNVEALMDLAEELDLSGVEELNASFNRFTESMSPETIKSMADLLAYDDPMVNRIKNDVEDAAFNAVKQIEKKTEEIGSNT